MRRNSNRPRCTGRAMLPVAALLALLTTGCATVVQDQVAVPGTNQRLLVGHDGWPNKKVWVLVDGKLTSVNIVREDRR